MCALVTKTSHSPTKLCDGSQMANFDDFWCPVFAASRVQHASDLHPKLALRPHHVWKYGRHTKTSNLRRLRLGEEEKKEGKKKPQDENIMSASATQGGHHVGHRPTF